MECLKNGDVVAILRRSPAQVRAGRAEPTHRDAVTVGFGSLDLVLDFLVHVVVGDKALEAADADALALDTANALRFALLLLRANTAADCGQGSWWR